MSVISRRELLQIAAGMAAAGATGAPARIRKAPIPTSANEAFPDDSKVDWRVAALVESYPRTNGLKPAPLTDGQAFEVRLPQAVVVYGIRVVGRAGGSYASCAELSGYG